jgi:hypothetical protein
MITFKEVEEHLKAIPEPTVDIEGETNVSFNRENLWHWYQNLIIMVDDLKNAVHIQSSKEQKENP